MNFYFRPLRRVAVVSLALGAMPALAIAQTSEEQRQQGAAVIEKLNRGHARPTLERMRKEFPFLAEATEGHALGDVWSREGLDDRTGQLPAVAATGETTYTKIHAAYALNVGASEEELKEVVNRVTITSGIPRAISASQVLSEIFAERRSSGNEQ